jgi:hypothetical protein
MTYKLHASLARNIAILRARAERYRRLAHDSFDLRTSEEAISLAQEIDAEIARLQSESETTAKDANAGTGAHSDCRPAIFSG